MSTRSPDGLLVLGIGNVLLGDEGIGVHVVRRLAERELPPGVEVLDGGTGGLHLLGPLQAAGRVLLVDATIDGRPAGSVRRLEPRFSSDYPRTLTAHDIGLKDLLDALHLLGDPPPVTLLAVSIEELGERTTELSPAMAERLPGLVEATWAELAGPARVASSTDPGQELAGGDVDDARAADERP